MLYENIVNLYAVITTLIALLLCFQCHAVHPRKTWVFAVIFLLCTMLSNYYWGIYTLIMNENPSASEFMAYLGWNLAYIPLLQLLIHTQSQEERKFFSPLALLPVPLNIAQFVLYLSYGGLFNNLWEGLMCTIIACVSLRSILYYMKNRRRGCTPPRVAYAGLVFIVSEYGMWTSSCFDWPDGWLNPYYLFSLAQGLSYLGIWHGILKTAPKKAPTPENAEQKKMRLRMMILYTAVTLCCSVGGGLLALWMRNVLSDAVILTEDSNPYRIIDVMLFIISWALALVTCAMLFVANYRHKMAEGERMREAKIIAEHASAAKSDFLANMSHEIRTPINTMLGMNEIILRESLQARDLLPKEREVIRTIFSNICMNAGTIESAGNSLIAIINDILDFSKIEAGKMELVSSPYKLSSVLNDLSNMIAFKASSKGLTFEVDMDDGIPDVLLGDEVRVRQILTNLLNNAVKYTDQGTVRLTVRGGGDTAVKKGAAILLSASVRDTGIGIREEDLGHLFSKFERLDMSRNSTVEGTGLGLAITLNLTKLMGGTIDVQSVYGEGSEFSVTIPQIVVSPEPVGNFREKFEKSMRTAKAGQDMFHAPDAHILIVDDTRMNLTVAEGLLKKTQIEIDTATSGAAAVELASTIRYDLILMDQRMPRMDGTEAMRLIRSASRGVNRDTPVICLTADAVSGAKEHYLAEGFTDYLTKPVNGTTLEKMLLKYLPAEKVLPVVKSEAEEDDSGEGTSLFASLREEGIQTETGLRCCQNDTALYVALLRDFSRESVEKRRNLQGCYESRDWQNYGTFVHSLKSGSKMIGAEDLSEQAARMEKAANEGGLERILREHEAMMNRYAAVVEAIQRVLPPDREDDHQTGGGEVLEFMPENDSCDSAQGELRTEEVLEFFPEDNALH